MSTTDIPQTPLTPQEETLLRQRLVDVRIANEKYLRDHPEVEMVIAEVTRQVLMRRPDEPVAYAEDLLATADLKKMLEDLKQQKAANAV